MYHPRKKPLVFTDQFKIYILGGGEQKKSEANKFCEVLYCRDFIEGREVMSTKCIPI